MLPNCWKIEDLTRGIIRVYGKCMVSVFVRSLLLALLYFFLLPSLLNPLLARSFDDFEAHPPIHIQVSQQKTPTGLSPDQIKAVYNLPPTGGKGTIAIIGAYNSPTVESDLAVFDKQFGLPSCTKKNGCLEIHLMDPRTKTDSGWSGETALDTQWSHAIAPKAKILLVEAKSASGAGLTAALDYARNRSDVVAISMSWGGPEYPTEESYDSHFTSPYGASFFASSGDNGSGVEWPAVSPKVISVGGTTLHFDASGKLNSETAWNGSGGGVSAFIAEPSFQTDFGILKINGKRAEPDVSYNADPASGFSVYQNGWMTVGGTSAGAPQWAAIRALGKNIVISKLYADATKKYSQYFRDVYKGTNGDCSLFCSAKKRYDMVTGLGSPITDKF